VSAPRSVRLVRVPGLRAAQRALALLACGGSPAAARDRIVLLPSRTAARALRRTIERVLLVDGWRPSAGDLVRLQISAPPAAIVWPDLVSRQELYPRLHARVASLPPLLTDVEREVLLRVSADCAASSGAEPPFVVRPGIVAAMLDLFESLGRLRRSLDDVERVAASELEAAADSDRGAARLLQQTRFMVAAFREYQARVERSGRLDEGRLRQALLDAQPVRPVRHVAIAVTDQPADAAGLWPADYEFLLTVPGLERIDVIATERELGAGYYERMMDALPGIEECRLRDLDEPPPLLAVPDQAERRLYFTNRDREDELSDVVRRLKVRFTQEHCGTQPAPAVPVGDTALVYQKPLPYLYLAGRIFGEARVPFQATDALPLAAEPPAAALDLVMACVLHDFRRHDVTGLLRSPHFDFSPVAGAFAPRDVREFDQWLRKSGFTAGGTALDARLQEDPPVDTGLRRAALAALAVRTELAPIAGQSTVTQQLATLNRFLDRYGVSEGESGPTSARVVQARAAVRHALLELARAYERFDPRTAPMVETASIVRRWIEVRTFAPRAGDSGVHLVDAYAARFGRFETVHLLGLVEGEWPGPSPRSIFYPASLLRQLGWPGERDRISAARAAFLDLLGAARAETSVSSFILEDDALVRPAVLLEDLDQSELAVRVDASPAVRIFEHEALSHLPVDAAAVSGETAAWLALRQSRSDPALPAFHGRTGPYLRVSHSPTSLDAYRDCPFKYFASRVLSIGEERKEGIGLDPLARGALVHAAFERFFDAWERDGLGPITGATLDHARQRFSRVVEGVLAALPEADRQIERARLLGSAAGEGMGDRVFRIEAVRPVRVVGRDLELPIDGEYTFISGSGERTVRLRGSVDRVDRLDDGTLRVIDYKSGAVGELKDLLQLPLYVHAVERALGARAAHEVHASEAFYVGLRGRDPIVPVITSAAQRAERLAASAEALGAAVDGIAAGEFPPRPSRVQLCAACGYPSVCRKDYVGLD
jgi:RecB family exonuclease/inactivated superfamily I helicase